MDPNSLYFAYKRKIFLSETGSPYPVVNIRPDVAHSPVV
jgi:hypothetical protein